MKKHRWFAVISAMVMALAAFCCKTDTETETITETKIEYVDKKADEIAPASVTELTATPKDSRILLTVQFAIEYSPCFFNS